jgi:hypothetical protein
MKKILSILSIAVLAACSSPLEKIYSEESLEQDAPALKEALDSNDLNLLMGSIFRLTLKGEDLSNMTYNEILEDGRNWKAEQERIEAEQKALQEKAAREEAERIARLQEAVMVTCFKKGFQEVNYQEYITYGFAIENKSDKPIRAIKGTLRFTDLFDDEISSIRFTYDDPVGIGEIAKWNAQTDYNQFDSDDSKLKNKDLENLKVVWEPIKIIFEDGSSLE